MNYAERDEYEETKKEREKIHVERNEKVLEDNGRKRI